MKRLLFNIGRNSACQQWSRYFSSEEQASSQASTVVIGGGCCGVSLAYHLAKAGQKDVVLLEKTELTAGSTWHAAGLTTYYNPGINMKKIHHYSLTLFNQLEKETGQPVGLHKCGSLRIAQTPDRVDEFRHQMSRQGWNEAEQRLVSTEEIKEMFPLLNMDTILAGLYNPGDGHIDPYSLTQAMAAGARKYGAKLIQNAPVHNLKQRSDGKWEVGTVGGTIIADRIVNTAGFWGKHVGELAGIYHPLIPIHHQYVVTKTIPEVKALKKEPPVLRDLENSYYLRQERDGLLIGPYERQSLMKMSVDWYDNPPPADFGRELFESDLDRLEDYLSAAMSIVPAMENAEIQTVVCGPITYSPDLLPMVGPHREADNYWTIIGASYGIIHSGGLGKYVSDWIINGEPAFDLIETDPNRYSTWANREYTLAKVRESYGMNNALAVPHEEREAGRPTERVNMELFETLKARGGEFGFKSGWESPLWFAKDGDEPGYKPSFRRTNWFEPVRREIELVMKNVGVIDLTAFAKFKVEGKDASAFMDYIIANNIPEEGKIVLCHLLSPTGKVYGELTVSALHDGSYFCVTGAGSEFHDLRWMEVIAKEKGFKISIANCTEKQGCLGLAGPKSRDVMQRLVDNDLDISNEAWKFMEVKDLQMKGISVRALRISYTGELGWELYMDMADTIKVYNMIHEEGEQFGIDDFGGFALNSLRLDKGFRAWGLEMNMDKDPIQAGLGMFIKANKKVDFIGKEAIKNVLSTRPKNVLTYLHVKTDNIDAEGNESVWYNGKVVGNTTSGTYSYTLGTNVAFAYLPIDLSVPGNKVQVELLGELYDATVKEGPPLKIESLRTTKETKEIRKHFAN